MSFNDFHFANRSNIATASWNLVVVWKYCFTVDENALDAVLLLLENRDAWWWLQCLLHLLLFASGGACFSNVHVLLEQGRVLSFVRSLYGSILFFFSSVMHFDFRCTRYHSSPRSRS